MNANDLVALWKDPDSRMGELAEHPAGEIDLDLAGAGTAWTLTTSSCLTTTTTSATATTVTTISTTLTTNL